MAPVAVDEDINLLIQDIVQASKLPPKARHTTIKPTVADLTSAAYDRGLLPDALNELINLVTTPNFLDQGSLNAIIRNLYPATRVSRDVVIRVLTCLGHGRLKASMNVQAALLRWLILVYHALDAPVVLSQSYHVLFSLLDTAATRPALSHLLALVTRRKHVKPFRIQALLNLTRQTGNEPCLVGLLRVFKDYYPEVIVGEAVRGKSSAFKHPDLAWRERLDAIQEAHISQTQDTVSRPRDGFRINRPLGRRRGNKVIPSVHTSHANENSVTLEEVENATQLAQSLDKLELPNQLVAVLADPLLQKLLLLRPSDEAYQRIANWLNGILQDVMGGAADEDTLWEVLDVVKDFVTHTKTLPPVLLNFFAKFFELWGGNGRADVLVDILAFAPFHDFRELYHHIFQPFETAVLTHQTHLNPSLLILYTNLLRHWTTILRSSDPLPSHANQTISSLIAHVNNIALTLIQATPTVETSSHILTFYEQFVCLVTDEALRSHISIELPPGSLIYSLFFSNHVTDMSRLCYILGSYKPSFNAAVTTRRSGEYPAYDRMRAQVGAYNGFLMDICNGLWRNRAFSTDEGNEHGCLMPQTTLTALTRYLQSVDRSYALKSILNFSYSSTLSYLSLQRVRELEDQELEKGNTIHARHAGPATEASLLKTATAGGMSMPWLGYRINVLNSLSEKGLPGIEELLKCTMTRLKKDMDAKNATGQ